jgi:hypothetical protein
MQPDANEKMSSITEGTVRVGRVKEDLSRRWILGKHAAGWEDDN